MIRNGYSVALRFLITLALLALPNSSATASQPGTDFGESMDVLRFEDAAYSNLAQNASALCPTCVTISPHGAYEDQVIDRNGGYRAVRFDLPFAPPYRMREVSFPSVTKNGVPAVFPSVRLCRPDASGRPAISAPIFLKAPYEASADGTNSVALDLLISEPGQTFYWIIEFPARSATYPNDQPFLRLDRADQERGFFAVGYELSDRGVASLDGAGLIVDMTCELSSKDLIPIREPSNLGANWRGDEIEFRFRPSSDTTALFDPMPQNSLRRTTLMYRGDFGPWTRFASIGPGSSIFQIPIDSFPEGRRYWAASSLDRYGNESVPSSVVIASRPTGQPNMFTYDKFEPNGRINEARPLASTGVPELAASFPAGDQDFYRFVASAGDEIHALARPQNALQGIEHLVLALALYDGAGKLIAYGDPPLTESLTQINYNVPMLGNQSGPRKFTLEVVDLRGSTFSPLTNRRAAVNTPYEFVVNVTHGDNVAREPSRIQAVSLASGPALSLATHVSENGRVVFRLVLPIGDSDAETGSVRIYDVRGRLIKTLGIHGTGSGRECIWDGAGANGTPVPSGVYFARLGLGRYEGARKFLLMR